MSKAREESVNNQLNVLTDLALAERAVAARDAKAGKS